MISRSLTPRIRSIQRGTITITDPATSNTATLSPAVVTSLTELRYLGKTTASAVGAGSEVRLVLTNSTTVTATRQGTAGNVIVSWEITERTA